MSLLQEEINKRRTFAIISHPDAGKTTLTEKLLLFGGAIRTAGAVKSNKIKKTTTSDFMEIEKQRGISVATSVMGFEYKEKKINILDTPGHKDFAEDTYRTLTAADSVIVVVDVAKGVEEQTERLVEVCKMRNIPIIVFINKLDREGKDPIELLDEVEQKLNITVTPQSWPIGMGKTLKGVYSIYEQNLNLFSAHSTGDDENLVSIKDFNDPKLDETVGVLSANQFREETNLISEIYPEFDKELYLAGELSPVFFGSAVNNFGVRELLDCFIEIAPSPTPSNTDEREVSPYEEKFTGFVFKIHANLDPNHRSRIAFVKVCSGIFTKNTAYKHTRLDKNLKFNNPTAFMASKKEIIDESFPGDIVGLVDSGNFKLGDTLTEGENLHFNGIPTFSPEQFRYVDNTDPQKFKQFQKGLEQLVDEGVAQLFTHTLNNRKIIGTVGSLQFDVIQHRLLHEYNASCSYQPIAMHKACWIKTDDKEKLKELQQKKYKNMATDKKGEFVFLADSAWALQVTKENFPEIEFLNQSQF